MTTKTDIPVDDLREEEIYVVTHWYGKNTLIKQYVIFEKLYLACGKLFCRFRLLKNSVPISICTRNIVKITDTRHLNY